MVIKLLGGAAGRTRKVVKGTRFKICIKGEWVLEDEPYAGSNRKPFVAYFRSARFRKDLRDILYRVEDIGEPLDVSNRDVKDVFWKLDGKPVATPDGKQVTFDVVITCSKAHAAHDVVAFIPDGVVVVVRAAAPPAAPARLLVVVRGAAPARLERVRR